MIASIMSEQMSPIAKKFLSAAVIYLILGLLAQAVTLFDVWLGFNPLAYTAANAVQEMLLLGWLTQLGLALVYDRWLSPPAKSAVIIFALFNIGLPLVLVGQPGLALFGGAWLGLAAALGGMLQFLAGIVLVRQVWRVLKRH
jgi:hypothetical protein